MKDLVKNIGKWFIENDKWAWLIFGLITGLTSCNWYNACHSGAIMMIFYVVYTRIEYKKDHSWLAMALVFLSSVAGQGLIKLFTEQ